MKYRTLQELVEAYKGGALNRESHPLVIDNDQTRVYVEGKAANDWVVVFDGGGPEDLLREALDLLDVPHEGA